MDLTDGTSVSRIDLGGLVGGVCWGEEEEGGVELEFGCHRQRDGG